MVGKPSLIGKKNQNSLTQTHVVGNQKTITKTTTIYNKISMNIRYTKKKKTGGWMDGRADKLAGQIGDVEGRRTTTQTEILVLH